MRKGRASCRRALCSPLASALERCDRAGRLQGPPANPRRSVTEGEKERAHVGSTRTADRRRRSRPRPREAPFRPFLTSAGEIPPTRLLSAVFGARDPGTFVADPELSSAQPQRADALAGDWRLAIRSETIRQLYESKRGERAGARPASCRVAGGRRRGATAGRRGPPPAGQRRVNPEAEPPVTSRSPAIISGTSYYSQFNSLKMNSLVVFYQRKKSLLNPDV